MVLGAGRGPLVVRVATVVERVGWWCRERIGWGLCVVVAAVSWCGHSRGTCGSAVC